MQTNKASDKQSIRQSIEREGVTNPRFRLPFATRNLVE
jgi:hypothetical protein